jgi:hypothetical protein
MATVSLYETAVCYTCLQSRRHGGEQRNIELNLHKESTPFSLGVLYILVCSDLIRGESMRVPQPTAGLHLSQDMFFLNCVNLQLVNLTAGDTVNQLPFRKPLLLARYFCEQASVMIT